MRISKIAGYENYLITDEGREKLKVNQVKEIKRKLICGYTQYDLADEFNVHQGTISQIATNKTWKWVTP